MFEAVLIILAVVIWLDIGTRASLWGRRILDRRFPNTKASRAETICSAIAAILGPFNLIAVLIALRPWQK